MPDKGATLDPLDVNGNSVFTHLMMRIPEPGLVARLLKMKKGFATAKGALTAAALSGDPEVVKLLLANGAGKGGEGKLAVQAVCDSNREDNDVVFDLLEKAGFRLGKKFRGGCVREDGD